MSAHSNGLNVKDAPSAGWEARKNLNYIKRVLHYASQGQGSLLDVGCADSQLCPLLKDQYPASTAIDIEQIPKGAMDCIQGDFLTYDFAGYSFDCILCLQVLEHLDDRLIPRFISRMRSLLLPGGTLIISVPYRWAHDVDPHHVQDPVTLSRFLSWFPVGVVPNHLDIVAEEGNPFRRLVAVFSTNMHPDLADPSLTLKKV